MAPDVGFGFTGGATALMVVVALAVIGLAVLFGVKAYRAAKRRRESIAATVAALHLGYLPSDPARTGYFSSPPFEVGDNRRATDVVWGTIASRPFEAFAYSYETHTTDSKGERHTTTHRFQVTWVPLSAAVATMRLTSDNSLLRLFAKMGARDLKVESSEFNDRWKVWCENERLGHALLTPRMIERFLAADVTGRGFVFEGPALMSYAAHVSDLSDLDAVVSMLYEIVDLIPGFLLEGPPEPTATA